MTGLLYVHMQTLIESIRSLMRSRVLCAPSRKNLAFVPKAWLNSFSFSWFVKAGGELA